MKSLENYGALLVLSVTFQDKKFTGVASRRSWRASDASSTADRNNATRAKLKRGSDTGGVAAGADMTTSTAISSGICAIAAGASDADFSAKVLSFDFAPPMTVNKFKTMQDKRVPVMIKCECFILAAGGAVLSLSAQV